MLSIKKISVASVFYSHIGRFRQIIKILVKYGFADILSLLKIERYIKIGTNFFFKKHKKQYQLLSRPERIRLALEELGPTFIKLGQIVSTRPDLIPFEYIEELTKLQDSVPSFSFKSVKEILKQELGKEIEEFFQEIDETPLAAASIGQVHKAKLKNGKSVVIKIQRPNIKKIVEIDLEILTRLAKLAENNLEDFEIYKPVKTVEEFSHSLMNELNYLTEASNIEQFNRLYSEDNGIIVPKVYRHLCSPKILVMDFIDGVKVSELDKYKQNNYNKKLIAERGANFIMNQVFIHGFFHADPHPGNIFILKNNKICFLDYGMVGRISRKDREVFSELVVYIAEKNEKKTAEIIINFCNSKLNTDKYDFERDISELIDKHLYLPLKDINISHLFYDIIEVLNKHSLGIKPHLFLMIKAIICIDTIARTLDPEFDIINHAKPFIKKIQLSKMSPNQIGSDLLDYGNEMLHFIREFPLELNNLVKDSREGKFKMEINHKGLDEMIYTHKTMANNLSIALVLSSIIIGSSLIILSGIPPKLNGIPIFGLIGYVISAIMGLWLLLKNIK